MTVVKDESSYQPAPNKEITHYSYFYKKSEFNKIEPKSKKMLKSLKNIKTYFNDNVVYEEAIGKWLLEVDSQIDGGVRYTNGSSIDYYPQSKYILVTGSKSIA